MDSKPKKINPFAAKANDPKTDPGTENENEVTNQTVDSPNLVPEVDEETQKTLALFDELRSRVETDSAKALIMKAKTEYNELEKRVGEREARSLVSNLVTERIKAQLDAAQANG